MRKIFSARFVQLLSRPALFVVLLFGVTSWAAAGSGSYTVDDLGVLPGDSSSERPLSVSASP